LLLFTLKSVITSAFQNAKDLDIQNNFAVLYIFLPCVSVK